MANSLSMLLLGAGCGAYFTALGRAFSVLYWPRVGGGLFAFSFLGAALGAAAVYIFAPREGGTRQGGRGSIYLIWGMAALALLAAMTGGSGALFPGAGLKLGSFPAVVLVLCAGPAFLAAAAVLPDTGADGKRPWPAFFFLGCGIGVAAAATLSSMNPRTLALAGTGLGTLPALLPGGPKAVLRRLAATVYVLCVVALMVTGSGIVDFDGPVNRGREPQSPWTSRSLLWKNDSRIAITAHEEGWSLVTVNDGLRDDVINPRAAAFALPPASGPDGVIDVLAVGLPKGGTLARLLEMEVSLTVVGGRDRLVRETRRRWPAFNEAVLSGKVRVLAGHPRRALGGLDDRYNLIVVSDRSTATAYLASALAFKENYLFTVEAFREYLARLDEEGLLYIERNAMGRVVTTLREAAGEGAMLFGDQVAVLGKREGLVSQCYFQPKGWSKRDQREIEDYARDRGLEIFFSPYLRLNWNYYYSLARGSGLKGDYFTTFRDLTPEHDSRPFFDHADRVIISPIGKPLPDERNMGDEEWVLQLIPPASGTWWKIIAAGMACSLFSVILPLGSYQHRTGLLRHSLPATAMFIWLGAGFAVGLRALLGFSRRFGLSSESAAPAAAIFLLALGAGWLAGRGKPEKRSRFAVTLAVLFALGALCHRAGALLEGVAPLLSLILPALMAAAVGFAAGRTFGSSTAAVSETFEGTESIQAATWLLTAVVAWAASNLAAAGLGFPTLWLTAAGMTLMALRSAREL